MAKRHHSSHKGYGSHESGHHSHHMGGATDGFVRFDGACHSGLPTSSKMSPVANPSERMHSTHFTKTVKMIEDQMDSDMNDIKRNKQHQQY